MGLTEQQQQKTWILIQKTLYESPDFDKLLSNMQVLSNVYKEALEEEDDDFIQEIQTMITRVKEFRCHKIIRKQSEIINLKIEVDDLVSKMMKSIDPKVMLEFNIYESSNV